jgi:hypothetical protein
MTGVPPRGRGGLIGGIRFDGRVPGPVMNGDLHGSQRDDVRGLSGIRGRAWPGAVRASRRTGGMVDWLVSALTEIGEVERARALCEKLLSYASPLLLYAEEIDAHNGRHLGNFPQAFSHLSLINAVMHLIRDDKHRSARTLS